MQWVGHVLCLDIVPCLDELIYINLFYLWEKLRYSSLTLGSQLNSNTLNLNILGKDNIVCISLVNATMCLNSIGEPNVPHLSNCN